MTASVLTNETGDRAHIGDKVVFVEERNGVAYYRKADKHPLNTSEDMRPLRANRISYITDLWERKLTAFKRFGVNPIAAHAV